MATTNNQAAKKTTKKRPVRKRATQDQDTRGQDSRGQDTGEQDTGEQDGNHSSGSDGDGDQSESRRRSSAPRASAPKRLTGVRVAAMAGEQLLEVAGRQVEGVTGLKRTDDGWTVQVEVVEVRRIPDTTDVLALYEVEVDSDGELESYRRLRRYARGTAGED